MTRHGRIRKFRSLARRASERGLTLIELLVSLAILMILTSFTVGGLSAAVRAFGADSRNRLEMATTAAGENLRGLIASAINLPQAGNISFDGQREELRLVILSEGRALRGGLQDVRIRRRNDELIVEVFGSPRENGDHKLPVSSTTIVRGLSDIRFRYFGNAATKSEAAWRNDWIKLGGLPALVEISLNFKDAARNGPAMVVALRNEGPSGGS